MKPWLALNPKHVKLKFTYTKCLTNQINQPPIEAYGTVLLNLAQLKSTNQHFKFLTDETLICSQMDFLVQASWNIVLYVYIV